MIIKKFLNYILGYLSITVEGYFVERFMNICISKKILLSNIKREKSTILHANIGITDFKKIKQVAKITKSKVKIIDKKGLPFLLKKYKKRKIFAIFLFLVCMTIFISSKFIWNIEITGETEIPQEEILEELKQCGLDIGKYKGSIDIKQIVSEIRLKRDDISWIGIDLEGTNVIVEVVDTREKPEIIDTNEYCNIVSNVEGVITKISVQNGTPLVKEGDMIKKGTVLVQGWMEGKYTGIRYVHASADIEAKVWYSQKAKVYKKQQENIRTGKEETKYTIKLNNFTINLWKTLSKFQNYDTIIESKKIKLFSNFYLPIEIVKNINYETEQQTITYGSEELKEKTQKQLEEKIESELKEGDIINKQINCEETSEYIEIEVIYEVLQNIGTKEKIVF